MPVITRFQGRALDIRKKSEWEYFPYHLLGLKARADAIIMGNDGTRRKEVLNRFKDTPRVSKRIGLIFYPINFFSTYISERIECVVKPLLGEALQGPIYSIFGP